MRGRRSTRRVVRTATAPDSGFATGAVLGFRPDEAVVSGGEITSWPSYIGNVTLTPNGTARPAPTVRAEFGGRLVVGAASGGVYSASHAAPAAYSVLSVFRTGAGNAGCWAHTNSGAADSGQSAFRLSTNNVYLRNQGGDATAAGAADTVLIALHTFSVGQASSLRVNALTPVAAPVAPVINGDTLHLFALSAANGTPLAGGSAAYGIARWLLWNRVLSAQEAAAVLNYYGAYYGVTIGA